MSERRTANSERLALLIYNLVGAVVVPVVGLLLLPFLLLIPRRRRTMFARLGFQAWPRSPAAVWVHALSVGELVSAEHLVRSLRERLGQRPLYLSVSTLSGRRLAEERLAEHVDAIFYFPCDLVFVVNRVVPAVSPALFVLVETDVWPGFLATLRRRRIPAMLLNGRLSPPTLRFYHALRVLFRPAFEAFDAIHPQSDAEADRFRTLGVDETRLRPPGNLKFDAAGSTPAAESIAALRERLGLDADDRVLIAGSTHAGEEAIVANAWRRLRETRPELKLILVPRRPERSADVAGLFDADMVALFTERPSSWSTLVVDEIGHLASLYALADVAFVGGSLVPEGGHNPLEPAACGVPVVFGPDMEDFPDVSRQLVEAGGATQVRDGDDLLETCRGLLEDDARAAAMGAAARGVIDANRGVTARILDAIDATLATSPPP